jgi:hypothetical protein
MPDSFHHARTTAVEVSGIHLHRRIGLQWSADDLHRLAEIAEAMVHH